MLQQTNRHQSGGDQTRIESAGARPFHWGKSLPTRDDIREVGTSIGKEDYGENVGHRFFSFQRIC